MGSLRKAGGVAALFMGAAYAFGFGLFFLVLDATGYEGAAGRVAFAIDHQAILTSAMIALYLVFGTALVILSYALDELFSLADQGWRRVATAFGIIWAAILFASGMIMLVGLKALPYLAEENIQHATHVWAAVGIVQDGLGGGIEFVGGVWSLFVAWLGLSTRALPKWLCWVAVLFGLAGVATALPALAELAAIFGLVQLIWFFALGLVLLRGTAEAN